LQDIGLLPVTDSQCTEDEHDDEDEDDSKFRNLGLTKCMSYSVDKLIEEWLAENEGEELPGKGKPLNLDEYFSWPEDLRLGYSLLKNSGHLPEEVEQLREIKRLEEELRTCPDANLRTRLERRLREKQVQLSLRLEQSRRQRKR
jgi:hypothetical protein